MHSSTTIFDNNVAFSPNLGGFNGNRKRIVAKDWNSMIAVHNCVVTQPRIKYWRFNWHSKLLQ